MCGNKTGIGAHTFIDLAWKNAIYSDGFKYLEIPHNTRLSGWEALLRTTIPDVLVVQNFPLDLDCLEVLVELKKRGTFIAHVIDLSSWSQELARRFRGLAFADLFFGEIEEDGAKPIIDFLGAGMYWILPCAADGQVHRVSDLAEANITHDVVFLGSKRTNKSYAFDTIIRALSTDPSLKTYFAGPFWNLRDYPMALIQRYCSKIKLTKFADSIAKWRLTVPLHREKFVYANAKVSLNIHERNNFLDASHLIVNGRTFKIAASGGVLFTDRVQPMRHYFEEEREFLSYDDFEDFPEKLRYLLGNKELRLQIRRRASKRAQNEHLQVHRLRDILSVRAGRKPVHMRRCA